jgi:hypothetical protein
MDAWISPLSTVAPFSGPELKLIESVGEYLEDEPVVAVVRGQTFVSPLVLPIIGPLLFVFLVNPRSVIVTDKSLITVQESIWFQSKVTRLISRYRKGAVPVSRTRLGLKIGEDRRIFAMLGSLPAMRVVASPSASGDASSPRA